MSGQDTEERVRALGDKAKKNIFQYRSFNIKFLFSFY